MANLSITRRCRRACGYCFARRERAAPSVRDMPAEVFDEALAFLARSGIKEARLLGGEPTEHPEFVGLAERARHAGFGVTVFTGDVASGEVLEYLRALPVEKVLVVLNAADPAVDEPALLRSQERLCATLGARVMLGVNVTWPGQDALHLLDWIERFGLRRTIRLGLAHPDWGGSNASFPLRRPRPVAALERLVSGASRRGVQVRSDCGLTPCLFPEGFLADHPGLLARARHPADPTGRSCTPTIDVLPDGDCIACYALSTVVRLPLPPAGDRAALVARFDTALAQRTPAGVFPACLACSHRERAQCDGGCRARRAHRLRGAPPIGS